MRTIIYNLSLLLMLLPIVTHGHPESRDFNGRHTQERKISKSFSVSPNALLEVDNKYGDIDIVTWDQNKVEIEVTLRTNGNDQEAVLNRLRELDVIFKNSNSHVSAQTQIGSTRSSFWSWITGGSSNVNIDINYKIKVPATNRVDLENSYGNINLDRLQGNASISCDYGQVFIGELLGDNNQIELNYSRNSHFGYIKSGAIDADYSDYTIEEVGALKVSADYSKSKINKVEQLDFNCDYGSMEVGIVKNIRGQGDYLSTTIGAVYASLNLSLDYGSATIDKMMNSLESVDIDSEYTTLKIGYPAASPWRYTLNSSYANIKGLEGNSFNNQKQHQSGSKRFFQGYHLSDTGAKVTINASYGSINFINAF